jgi:citrate lyase subunit beta / citryl-CoA lyase
LSSEIRPRRSVLYVPGGNPRMHEKARGIAADCVVIDLEDSVAPEAKADARKLTAETVRAGGFGPREVVIRINQPGSEWFAEDLEAAGLAGPDAVLVTKTETPEVIVDAALALARLGLDKPVSLWAMIETPRGVINASAIADLALGDNAAGLAGLVIGTNDIAKATKARAVNGRAALVPSLVQTINAARAAGIFVLDGVFNDFSDMAGYEAECVQGRDLGFDGKTLIHPSQVELANKVFSPSEEEVDEARRIIAAFDLPENKGKGAIRFEGRMVEILHADVARQTLALAEAIQAQSV